MTATGRRPAGIIISIYYLGEFYLYTMALVSTSILVTIGVLSLHFGPSDPPPVPAWLNKLIKLSAVKVRVFFIKVMHPFCHIMRYL